MHNEGPRGGWASIDLENKTDGLIIITSGDGSCDGFTYCDGEMIKTCICNAYEESECGCGGVDWSN